MKKLENYTKPTVLFVDMNSFFASCEQQVNYYLRHRPVAVCVYTGQQGCVIAPSVEAKARGVKLGMRLDEAITICPDLIPVETHPNRYREYHKKVMDVLRQFSEEVLPKSIDEAVVDLTNYQLVYPDMVTVARQIKQAIRKDVGDWLRCSIGIAPNAFLAKLASDIQKPDGLTVITPETIDGVLQKLTLTDLPGIGERMAVRLQQHGIMTPLDLRYSTPERLRSICQSIVGWHWHLRLNFGGEVDMDSHAYKSMQAMRTLSVGQRQSAEQLDELLMSLCLTLERRMVRQDVFCQVLTFHCRYYGHDRHYHDEVKFQTPLQDGPELYRIICDRMARYERTHQSGPVLNESLRSISVGVYRFVPAELVPYKLFEDTTRKDKLRKTLYELKDKFGADKLMRASELRDEPIYRDVIGFGSIKDLHDDRPTFE